MRTVLAIQVDPKLLPELVEQTDPLRSQGSGELVPGEQMHVHLGEIDSRLDLSDDGPLARALNKAANAQQGFRIALSGLKFEPGASKGLDAYIPVQRKEGMLQSIAFSVAGRMPDPHALRFEEPWKAKLTVARFGGSVSELDRLKLEAALVDRRWEMAVKEIAVLQVGEGDSVRPVLTAKLTSSGG